MKPERDPVAFIAARLERARPGGPFREGAFSSPLHDERVAARLGVALGIAFLTCFATGLVSHSRSTRSTSGFSPRPPRPAGCIA